MTWISGALSQTGLRGQVAAFDTRLRWRVEQAVQAGAPHWPAVKRLGFDAALLLGCAGAGALAAVSPKHVLIALALLGVFALIMVRPEFAAYLLIFLTPVIVGINAGSLIPLVRPNEALIALFGLAIAVRWLVHLRAGERTLPRLDAVDVSITAIAVTSSVLPLMMMVARQRAISKDDLLYSIVMWKLLAEYVIVRSVIKTGEQAMRCLWLSMWSAAVVCVVGIFQALHLFGVQTLLARYYAPLDVTSALSISRGSSLLGLPAAVADLAILNLAIAIGLLVRGHRRRLLLGGLAVIFALGVVAAAEFSTFIGLLVAVVAIVILTRSGRILLYAAPVALAGGVLLWPVIALRLSGFHGGTALPYSWVVRLQNLRTYFWPTMFSDWNWILGVRPSARVLAPTQEYGYVWIESGYTWLLWGGGIPLLASYLAFVWAAVRKGAGLARRGGAAGAAGVALAAYVASQAVMMGFDPHLTFRGSGDELFLILGLLGALSIGSKPGQAVAGTAATAAPPLEVAA